MGKELNYQILKEAFESNPIFTTDEISRGDKVLLSFYAYKKIDPKSKLTCANIAEDLRMSYSTAVRQFRYLEGEDFINVVERGFGIRGPRVKKYMLSESGAKRAEKIMMTLDTNGTIVKKIKLAIDLGYLPIVREPPLNP